MAIEFKMSPKETREMDAADIELYMKLLYTYKQITGSEQSQAIKGIFGQ